MHPSLRIIALILLAIVLQSCAPRTLGLIAFLTMLAAFSFYSNKYWRMLLRSRWLLFTLLLIFAFTTPGEFVPGWPADFAPSFEGISMGLQQALRLTTMLAGLALLLGSTPRAALMSGLYELMQPLRYLGWSPVRFTARLWLTLHYVEEAPRQQGARLAMLDALALETPADLGVPLVLHLPQWRWFDGLLLVLFTLSAWWWF